MAWLSMARRLRQFLACSLAIALVAGGIRPLPMIADHAPSGAQAAAAQAEPAHSHAATQAEAMPRHGMAMPCEEMAADDAAPAAGHQAPACPNMMLCCIGAVPALPAGDLGIGAPVTAGTVLRLVLERAGDGHVPSPLPEIPRA